MGKTENNLPVNWPYVVVVAFISTAAIGFIVWQTTAQVYRPWADHGMPIGRGWNWPLVIVLDAICILSLLALFWKIYCDAHTQLGEAELCKPGLFGIRRIHWSEIVQVKIIGFGYHISSKSMKIVVSPYAYRNPDAVITVLRTRIANGKGEAIDDPTSN